MPLHLLGQKSWNVYNPANIARVQRDEAAAQAREEAHEQRMQEADAARRLAILRGETPPPLSELEQQQPELEPKPKPRDRDRDRDSYSSTTTRKRKRHGEDDTDFEMRIARERAAAGDRASRELGPASASSSHPRSSTRPGVEPSLVDSKGHIALFSPPSPSHQPREPHPEVAREAARKERELKDQYQMRLVNAAGKDGVGLTDGGPWYAAAAAAAASSRDGQTGAGEGSGTVEVVEKNVFGRDDPGRKVRAAARLDAGDPLGMMKRGAKMVRELERERRKEREERDRGIRELEREGERRERKRRRRDERREDGSDRREHRHRDGDRDRDRDRGHSRRDEQGHREERDGSRKEERTHRDRSKERGRQDDGHRSSHRRDGSHRRSHKREDRDSSQREPRSH
ncbi:hypothetical protein B0J18DRAFT_430617 [Chaetomium sp. MPI-SDFR-AT-0129]|nr:hypothetical protein B0J18DRAFT_430617 [Chaetomium sp. MPI-SDFR-AT-0129]